MRLDGVEVKISLDRDQTAAALAALRLSDVAPWSISFVEDVTVGLCSSTPLLDMHLIIRAREKAKGIDDVTVKFRPGRRSQLTDAWLATTKSTDGGLDAQLKVEEDWAGDRRMLAISLTADRPDGVLAAAREGDVAGLLTQEQRQLVEHCAGDRVNLAVLTMLPALTAMRWPTFAIPGPGGSEMDVRAERWTIDTLDFLELSIAVEVGVAQESQAALEAFVADNGLQASAGQAKTSQVLQLMVAKAACGTGQLR